jgi:hypothetical protein
MKRLRAAVSRYRLPHLIKVLRAFLIIGKPNPASQPPDNPKLYQVFVQQGRVGVGRPIILR